MKNNQEKNKKLKDELFRIGVISMLTLIIIGIGSQLYGSMMTPYSNNELYLLKVTLDSFMILKYLFYISLTFFATSIVLLLVMRSKSKRGEKNDEK